MQNQYDDGEWQGPQIPDAPNFHVYTVGDARSAAQSAPSSATTGTGQGGGFPWSRTLPWNWFRGPQRGPVTPPTFGGQPGQPISTNNPENVAHISNYANNPYIQDGPVGPGGYNAPKQPFFTGRDLVQFGAPAASNIITTLLGTHANNKANSEALALQQAQYDRTQAFLEQQQREKLAADAAIEAEKRRQFDALEAEKRRRYDARQPWRDAGQANLVRMSDLLDAPRPQYVPYTGNAFTQG
jgi:hypothetical protein